MYFIFACFRFEVKKKEKKKGKFGRDVESIHIVIHFILTQVPQM